MNLIERIRPVTQASQDQKWYVLRVKARHEKIVEKLLDKKGVTIFLPVRKIQRKWSDRKKMVTFPLFPGYLFVFTKISQKREILTVNGVVQIVGKPSPVSVPVEQIDSIRKFVELKVEIDPYPHYTPGRRVEVRRGVFKGITGVLERKKGKYRLVINIDLIQQSASVEIDADDVVLCD